MHKKKQPLSSLKDGERVDDIFVVKIKRGVSQYAKGYRFQLILTDSSGKSIEYNYWGGESEEEVRTLFDSIKTDGVVLVRGRFSMYEGKPRISTNPPDTIMMLDGGEYDVLDFVRGPQRPLDEMEVELKELIRSVQDSEIQKVLEGVFEEGFMEKFRKHPGAIEIHHNWIGGLLQHTLEVARYCELTWKIFPELDRDVLVAGAILHDIGKVEEIAVTSRIKGTLKGNLKGHVAMGYRMVSDVMNKTSIGEDVRNRLLHIMLSHHGHSGFGSPKEPMFSEAMAVYYADALSSKVSEFVEFTKNAKDSTEDDFMYSRRHGRNIYLR